MGRGKPNCVSFNPLLTLIDVFNSNSSELLFIKLANVDVSVPEIICFVLPEKTTVLLRVP